MDVKKETPIHVDHDRALYGLCDWDMTVRKQDSGRAKERDPLLLTMCHSDK